MVYTRKYGISHGIKFRYTILYHMYKKCVIYHGIYQKIWYITWYIPYFTWYIPYLIWYIPCDITFISASDLLLGHVIYQYFVVIYHGISHSFGIYQAIYHVKCSFDLLLGHVIYLVLQLCTSFFRDIAGRTWLYADVYHTPISQRWYISGYGGIYLMIVWDIIWYMMPHRARSWAAAAPTVQLHRNPPRPCHRAWTGLSQAWWPGQFAGTADSWHSGMQQPSKWENSRRRKSHRQTDSPCIHSGQLWAWQWQWASNGNGQDYATACSPVLNGMLAAAARAAGCEPELTADIRYPCVSYPYVIYHVICPFYLLYTVKRCGI